MLRAMDAFTPAVEIAAAIRRKEISPVEVADLYLDRIEQFDGTLNAFCHRADDEVRGAAKRAADVVATSDTTDLPPFFGVPLPIKDLNAVAGWPSTRGSRGTSWEPQTESDLVVERFVEAGFILLGMTNAPEFGTVSYTESDAHGVTRNPWNPDHTPGGSSGGAGAAVASGMAPIAHASDGGGSIRIPAACNGLVGLKPSRNRVPNRVNELEGLATSGVLTRTVLDTATALDIIGRPDPLGWYNAPPPAERFATSAALPPPRLRVGYTIAPPLEMEVAPACVAAVSKTVDALAANGHEVYEVSLSVPDADAFVESFGLIWNTGSAGIPIEDWRLVEPLNRTLHEAGKATDSVAYVEAVQQTQRLARPLMAQFIDTFDVLVTPTMATLAPRCGSVWEGADEDPLIALLNCYPMAIFTSIFNVTGLPAISVPVHHDEESGLPACVQIAAGPWRDDLALQVAAQLEIALPWKDRRPPIS
jgi:amidase